MQVTFPRLMLDHAADGNPDAPALREKDLGIWQTTSWRALATLVAEIAGGLAQAGMRRGDHLVVVGENRPRLYAAMIAAQALGAVPIPLYQDAVADEFVFPITNAEVGFAIVEDQEQVDKMMDVRGRCTHLGRVWYDDPRGLRRYAEPGLAPLDALIESGRACAVAHPGWFEAAVAQVGADDVAAIFFTSGTTGNPKGVVHTHRSLIASASAAAAFDRLTATEEVLAYLPPAWIGQNTFSYAQWLVCGYVVNCPESASTVSIDLNDIGPTYFFAPPRIFEALLTTSDDPHGGRERASRNGCSVHFMGVARRVGPLLLDGQPVGVLERLRYALGQVLIYGPLRNTLGLSRVRVAYTAGEAIGPDLFSFYRSIGINLKQLYGSTETAVFVCVQPDTEARADTVGVPLEGRRAAHRSTAARSSVKLGTACCDEYYRNPEATAEVLTPDGWFRTGDAGFLDAGGHLKIIDRAKDVGRLLGGPDDGAMFAPKYVENKLKFFPYIKEAVAIGDRRATVCAMVNIDFEAVGNWAEKRNLPYAGYADLAQKPEVIALVRECVEKVNADLARDDKLAGSQISRFLILHKELDADDGELTRTRKVRRGFIAQRYQVLVDALYAGLAHQYVETPVKFEDGRSGLVSADLKIVDLRRSSRLFEAEGRVNGC